MNGDLKGFNKGFNGYDEDLFLKACELGLNEAISFMVLCCGTGGDRATTKWSAKAIESHGGMGRVNARKAIASLLKNEIIRLSDHSKPNYPQYKVNIDKGKDDWVWIPNSVITGVIDESTGEYLRSPLAQIKRSGSIDYLKAFFFLYKHHYLDPDGGISRELIYIDYDFKHLKNWGAFSFYTHDAGNVILNDQHEILRETGLSSDKFLSIFHSFIHDYKLIEKVDYVFESKSLDSDIVYPVFGPSYTDNEVVQESEVYWERQDTNLIVGFGGLEDDSLSMEGTLLSEKAYEDRDELYLAREYGQPIVPVIVSARSAHLFGVYRMRFRPHTRATQAWYGNVRSNIDEAIRFFNL